MADMALLSIASDRLFARSVMRRVAPLLLLCSAVLFAVWFVAMPAAAARALVEAARSGDLAEISERVDFPMLRQSLSAELSRAALAQVGAESGAAAALGGALANAVVGPAVERLVTPSGVALLLQGTPPDQRDRAAAELREFDVRRDGLGRFEVVYTDADLGEFALLFRRTLTGGVLDGVRLP